MPGNRVTRKVDFDRGVPVLSVGPIDLCFSCPSKSWYYMRDFRKTKTHSVSTFKLIRQCQCQYVQERSAQTLVKARREYGMNTARVKCVVFVRGAVCEIIQYVHSTVGTNIL